MKFFLVLWLLTATPLGAQTTFIVKKPDGKPAKGVIVHYRQRQVAKTNALGEVKLTEKITQGDTIRFYDSRHFAWHIAAADGGKVATFTVQLQAADQLPPEQRKEVYVQTQERSMDEEFKSPTPQKAPDGANEVYVFADEEAEFPGGYAAMNAFLNKNLEYPETARTKKISGKCYVKFIVDTDGKVSDIQVARGVEDCPECDEEAIRVVQMMPKWKPGNTDGKPGKSYFTLPLLFSPL